MPVLVTDQPIMSANASSKTRFRNRQNHSHAGRERLANSAQDRGASQARPDSPQTLQAQHEPLSPTHMSFSYYRERLVNSAQDSRDWGLAGSAGTQGAPQARRTWQPRGTTWHPCVADAPFSHSL
ncbi:hypothetical protein L227DRAFT_602890 [Lentinus tigrinus ALCF2SS1-6]|uniref:Uncharacterized protein n=1 Tax=Lentinus tigrinus ALCF2SS1-6 TaxID=1328759 RepID=A0A5C2S017_9APHY|nr:hypothetical protein L227DRAFT_602890 [Lentinus tigrinus ALCF2SS1-6]